MAVDLGVFSSLLVLNPIPCKSKAGGISSSSSVIIGVKYQQKLLIMK
jgi:hypothetical protein